jgi:hypothetical protein
VSVCVLGAAGAIHAQAAAQPAQQPAPAAAPPPAAAEATPPRDADAAPRTKPGVDPLAIGGLRRMGAFLRTLSSFEVKGQTTVDEVLESGQKFQLGADIDLKVRRPDKLRATIASDRKTRELVYDGKTLTVFGPRNKFYATVDAPPTVMELVRFSAERYGIEFPLADLFVWGTDEEKIDAIQSAIYLGPSRIGGALTDQYAFRQPDVDWQVWIQRGDQALPRKLVITTRTEPSQPQRVSTLEWNLAPKLDDSVFTFVPPEGAKRIELQPIAGGAGATPDRK